MPDVIKHEPNGQPYWYPQSGDYYEVTGTLPNGRRFPAIRSDNWNHARGYNIYRGTFWLVRNGKRHRIYSVSN